MEWHQVMSYVPDVIQIFILYMVIYAILKGARGSRFGQVLMGSGILFGLLIAFTLVFHFDVLSVIVRWLLLYLALSSVVIFQDEIRRILATMGSFLFQDRARAHTFPHERITPEDLTTIIFKLAKRRTGALVAFERGISLRGFETTGVALDAIISPELFFSIFTEPMPLHDGGVIIRWLLLYLALSSVVIFQDEIRRFLAAMGSFLFQDRTRTHAILGGRVSPEDLTTIIFKLAKKRTGALVAFERGISLRGFETTGVALDAIISSELFFSIFTEPMPLHDGGVVIRHGRVAAAHCLFPVSSQSDLSASGMRHRAAVGLSEQTDALVIVVSEETGRVSVAHNGRLIRYPDAEEDARTAILRWVRKAMPQQKTTAEAMSDWMKRRTDKLFRRRHDAPEAAKSAAAAQEAAADAGASGKERK